MVHILRVVILIAVLFVLSGCCGGLFVREAPYVHDDIVWLSDSSSTEPVPDYILYNNTLGFSTSVSVRSNRDLNLNREPSILLVDLTVYPKAVAKRTAFRPDGIKIAVSDDTLQLIGSKTVCYRCWDFCSYRSIFRLNNVDTDATHADGVTSYTISFDHALSVDDTPALIGRLTGSLNSKNR